MKFWITTALLAASIGISTLGARRYPDALAAPLDSVSLDIAGWTLGQVQAMEPRTLQTVKPTTYLARSYRKNTEELNLFIAYYSQQRAGESMHSPKACLPASGWEIWKYETADLAVDGKPITVNKYFIQKAGQRQVVFYWYQSRERVIASEYAGKLLLIKDSLLSGRTAGSLVRVMIPDRPGLSEEGLAFASQLIPQVQKCFHP